jgi:putative ABC transport system permease protein
MRGMWNDLRYSVKALRGSPGFAAVAFLVLGLGIGLNVAMFSLVNAVLLHTPVVPSVDRLVYIYDAEEATIDIATFRQQFGTPFSGVAAHTAMRVVFSADGQDDRITGELVTANYFDVVGVGPTIGRTFRPEEDDTSNGNLAVVISHDLWTRRFQGDAGIVGKQVRIDGRFFVIIGVASRKFDGIADAMNPSRFWITSAQYYGGIYRGYSKYLVASLRPDATVMQARALLRAQPDAATPKRKLAGYLVLPATDVIMPFAPLQRDGVLQRIASGIGLVTAVVMLIAAANITGILMARGVARTSELAVRQALGASTSRLVRQLLTESVLLSAPAGIAGWYVAWGVLALYRAYSPGRFVADVTADVRVVVFTAAVCVGVGLLVGIVPALQARKVDVNVSLGRLGAATATGSKRRLRHAIVLPQIALSMVLLVVASVHARSLLHFEFADTGYRIRNVAVMTAGYWVPPGFWDDRVTAPAQRAERSRTFFRDLLARVREVPGMKAAGLATKLPVAISGASARSFVTRETIHTGGRSASAELGGAVSDGYFLTMGIPILSGRDFDERDGPLSRHVAIVSESLARRLWPGGDAVGSSLASVRPGQTNDVPQWLEVVGVVGDARPVLHEGGDRPFVYTALSQLDVPGGIPLTLVAWGGGDEARLVEQTRQAVVRGDPFAQVPRMQTMTQYVAEVLYPRRAAAWLLGVSGGVGLLLAAIGLYGVISYSVSRQVREIGIRSALGAERKQIMAVVLREGLAVFIVAAVPGLALSFIALRLTSAFVGHVPATDAVSLIVVPLMTAVVVLLASYLPARRAAQVDPMVALRAF